jgi:transcriptional regulator with XRE-family HTH domain
MAKAPSNRTKSATVVDTHVGQKIRDRRIFLGMSQAKVAGAIGIAFQQIQKYETGMNRVGASSLQQISEVLGVSPFYFFEGGRTSRRKKDTPAAGRRAIGIHNRFIPRDS